MQSGSKRIKKEVQCKNNDLFFNPKPLKNDSKVNDFWQIAMENKTRNYKIRPWEIGSELLFETVAHGYHLHSLFHQEIKSPRLKSGGFDCAILALFPDQLHCRYVPVFHNVNGINTRFQITDINRVGPAFGKLVLLQHHQPLVDDRDGHLIIS